MFTELCDWQQLVTESTEFFYLLYTNIRLILSNIWLTVQQYVTDSTAISDWLYGILQMYRITSQT